MIGNQRRRNGFVIAYLAIACVLVLVPVVPGATKDSAERRIVLLSAMSGCFTPAAALHTGSGASNFATILPLLMAGFVLPLALFTGRGNLYVSRTPQAAALAQAFERPPPRR
jgi:hypothetical protein